MIIKKQDTLKNINFSYYKKDVCYLLETILGKKNLLSKLIFYKILDWNKSKLNENSLYNNNPWQTSYKNLQEILGFSREAIRLNLLKLEKFNLIKRKIETKSVKTKKGYTLFKNKLCLILRTDVIDNFFELNFSLLPSKKWGINKKIIINNIDLETSNLKNENTSIKLKSNLDKTVIHEINTNNTHPTTLMNITKQNNLILNTKKSKTFLQCLPVTEKEAEYLRSETGKKYSTLFINELVKYLYKERPNFKCWYRKGFLDYMLMSVKNEKRNVKEVNAGKYEFVHTKEYNKVFTKIENSTKRTIDVLIKKRITSYFTPELAIFILKNYSFPEKVIIDNTDNRVYGIYYQDNTTLNNVQKEKLIKFAQECSSYTDKVTGEIKSAKVLFLKNNKDHCKITQTILNGSVNNIVNKLHSSVTITDIDITTYRTDIEGLIVTDHEVHPIWRAVRKQLLARHKLAVDKSWFSKINFNYDDTTNIVVLQYPSTFMQQKADQDYGSDMYGFIRNELPTIEAIKSKVRDSNYVENVWWLIN